MADRDKVARALRWPGDRTGVHPSMCQRLEMADAAIAAVLEGVERVFDGVRSEPGITDHDRLLINTLLAEVKAAFLQPTKQSNPAE